MRIPITTLLVALLLGLALVAPIDLTAAPAPQEGDPEGETRDLFHTGWAQYQRYCKNCHGAEGRGDGTVAKWLKIPPTDLTQLSENNGGSFPRERVAKSIDGRENVRLHGAREMPIWGKVLQDTGDPDDPEGAAKDRVEELLRAVEHLDSKN